MLTLTGKQKRYLRGLAHPLKPIAQIGKSGLDEGFFHQVDQYLWDHELIKIKVLDSAPDSHKVYAPQVAEQLNAVVAQLIGHTIVLYRPHPDEPVISLPKA